MLYTGLDLLEIERIRESVKNPRFVARVFSDEEQAYFATQRDPAPSMAASFAAKEAFAKALGTGVRQFQLREVWVRHDALGAPSLQLTGTAARLAADRGLSFSLSLTHTATTAAAVVVAWSVEELRKMLSSGISSDI